MAKRPDLNESLKAAEEAARGLRHASRSHARLSDALAAVGRRDEALSALKEAWRLSAGNAEDYEALAFSAFGLGAHELARDGYAQVTQMVPHDATAWYNLATSERNLGDFAAAERACHQAISWDPQFHQAYLLRSQLRTQTTGDNHIEALLSALTDAPKNGGAQIFLHYSLGKEFDDIGDYDAAFSHFSMGAQSRRASLKYDVVSDVQKLQRIVDVFDLETVKQGALSQGGAPYAFILGLPRSGTTLIERVLTGHAHVRSNGETDNFAEALIEVLPDVRGDVFARAARADPLRVAEGYVRRAGPGPGGGLVLEKLPLNYLYLGAIGMALPESKILLVRRGAVDNCFAMYSTLFGSGYPFSYDFQELAAYYAAFDRLIRHWKTVLPEQILEVSYEAFVDDPTSLGPPIAHHVGLDWQPSMLKIEENSTGTATASAVQVRRPIYKSAAGRWRGYAKHLEPLASALRAAGVDLKTDEWEG